MLITKKTKKKQEKKRKMLPKRVHPKALEISSLYDKASRGQTIMVVSRVRAYLKSSCF